MRFRKLRIAWSVVWLIALLFVPPAIQEPLARVPDIAWLWPMLIVCASMIIAPWLPTQYSLRTLLIATTLVAVVLGLVVWAMHG
jgi:hypothetical protein